MMLRLCGLLALIFLTPVARRWRTNDPRTTRN